MAAVTVYSTGPACQRCRLTCRRLEQAGIPYRVVDLTDEANAGARASISDDLGYIEAPVVILDSDPEHHWSGFRPDLIDALAFQIRRTAADRMPVCCMSLPEEASNVQR